MEILVSIISTSYNHEKYLRQCLDGFVMQQTNFNYEIIIHDDASTDSSQEIIKEYCAKYPDLFVPILQTENQYSKGVKVGATFMYPKARGKYIAECEGDDYWTDPLKLQKQVDFLESHKDYSMCFHTATIHWEDGREEDKTFRTIENREYTGEEILRQWTIATASVLYRTEIVNSDLYKKTSNNKKFIYGDITTFLACANYGKIYGMSDNMSVYRKQPGGAVFNYSIERQKKQAYHELEIYKVFGKRYKKVAIQRFAQNAMNAFWGLKENGFNDWKLLYDITRYSPSTLFNEIKKKLHQ